MPVFINYLKNRDINQVTSEYALDEFKNKAKTPIMGGLLFVIIPIIVAIIVKPDIITDKKVLFVICSYVLYCSVGFIDDYLIISSHFAQATALVLVKDVFDVSPLSYWKKQSLFLTLL